MNNIKTLVSLVSILFIALCLLNSIVSQKKIEIDFFDVGQGDASLIKLPNNKHILVDGGPDNLILRRLGENLSFFSHEIEFIVLSHFHDDHLIGLFEVIRRYRVGVIIYMKGAGSSDIFQLFLKKAQEKNIKLIALENEVVLNYSPNCIIKILNPLILAIKKDSNNSLITKIDCQGLSAIFTGDSGSKVEEALLKSNYDFSAEILKASHHGSKSANSEDFLKKVGPDFFVISVGANNRFGHPAPEIIDLVEKQNIKIKRTDLEGTIKIFGAQ